MAISDETFVVQQFRYRKHIKHIRTFVTILCLISIIISIISALISGIYELLFLAIPFVLEGAVIWAVYGRFINTRVIMDKDSIFYTCGKRETIIPYDQITKIQVRSIRYLGGWIKIKSNKKTIRLTVVVENIQSLLQILKANLDTRGMNNTYNAKKLFRFLKTATFSDEGWARFYKLWWKLLLLTILTAIVGIAIAIVFNLSATVVFFSTIFPTCFLQELFT